MSRPALLERINASAPCHGHIQAVEVVPFGPRLNIERFRLSNGLEVLLCEDGSAPVVAYHTWFRVGSRHEREGKTGQAHLLEHLMFNETSNRGPGEFDRALEQAGAENNASTWLDWTHYTIHVPSSEVSLVVELEADRMNNLVLRDAQVQSELEVVANERRYRVEDDVEGFVTELMWATAFTRHSYRWPTIGWMADILAFRTSDCREFYDTYYSPGNATLVVVGDVRAEELLPQIVQAYGIVPPHSLPVEGCDPEPPQLEERRVEVEKPTLTEKLAVGYHAPALGDVDHLPMALLADVLLGGRASRLQQRLVHELELASDLRVFLGPFRDPGLFEIYASARGTHTAEQLLAVIDEEMQLLIDRPVSEEELDRARARTELAIVMGLETADGRASTIGFHDVVLGRPAGALERLDAMQRLTCADLLRVARRYLRASNRSVVLVRCASTEEEAS